MSLTHAQRETVRCALLRGLSDPDDEGMTCDSTRKGQDGEEEGVVTRRGIRRRYHATRVRTSFCLLLSVMGSEILSNLIFWVVLYS